MQKTVGQVVRDQRRERRVKFLIGLLALAFGGVAWAGLSREPLNRFDGDVFRGPIGIPEPVFIDEDFPLPAPPAMLDEAFPVPLPTPVPFDE